MSDDDPHESVTIAPPAPNFAEILLNAAPVPSLSSRSDQHLRAAVDAGSRADSTLSELSKIVAALSGGLSGATQANQQLAHELSRLRAMLAAANEQQLAQDQRIARLEQELMVSQSAAERERQFLTDQHDDFLAAILEEHEQALRARDSEGDEDDTLRFNGDVAELARQLVQTESARLAAEAECVGAREALAKLQAQRDEAQARADKRERERDELRAEASQLRARLGTHRTSSTTVPPPLTSRRPPSFRPPLALQLDSGELDSTLHARSSAPRVPSARPRLAPASSELERALYTSEPTAKATVAEPFPRESTRPGVGGPKPSEPPPPPSFGPPPSGWTPSPPTPEVSPAPRPALVSAASLPPGLSSPQPILKQKPDPTTRPLIDYSLGKDGVLSETLEGARLSSKPPRK
jgi:regulator of replication initiation timing